MEGHWQCRPPHPPARPGTTSQRCVHPESTWRHSYLPEISQLRPTATYPHPSRSLGEHLGSSVAAQNGTGWGAGCWRTPAITALRTQAVHRQTSELQGHSTGRVGVGPAAERPQRGRDAAGPHGPSNDADTVEAGDLSQGQATAGRAAGRRALGDKDEDTESQAVKQTGAQCQPPPSGEEPPGLRQDSRRRSPQPRDSPGRGRSSPVEETACLLAFSQDLHFQTSSQLTCARKEAENPVHTSKLRAHPLPTAAHWPRWGPLRGVDLEKRSMHRCGQARAPGLKNPPDSESSPSQGRGPWDDAGRDWSDADTSQGCQPTLAAEEARKEPPQGLWRECGPLTSDSRLWPSE